MYELHWLNQPTVRSALIVGMAIQNATTEKNIPSARDLSLEELNSYDHIIVMFSGGKDSVACHLNLLQMGVDSSKIELWHHDIDGREGERLFDWAITRDYCQKYAKAFNTPIYFSWLEGGFEREMTRDNQKKSKTWFEVPKNGDIFLESTGGIRGNNATRMKFPQIGADLSTRWCSAYLKIDVATAAIINQERFQNSKTLVITGERGEESPNRARYEMYEPDRSDNRNGSRVVRVVDHWRPIRDWSEGRVWAIMAEYRVNPHPAYKLGFGRCSCLFCIFGNQDQFETARFISPLQGERLAQFEEKFSEFHGTKVTLKRKDSLRDLYAKGKVYEATLANPAIVVLANSEVFNEPIIIDNWTLPAGAYAESCGPS